MAKSSEHVTGPFMASAYQNRQFVRACIGGQAACTASQMCGTEKESQEFSSELQVRHMSF
eukprot:1079849-Pelagomonas_calceolata.AAC.1